MKLYPHNTNYLISKEGEVWSTFSNRFLKPGTNNSGHFHVNLWEDKKVTSLSIHRLVLETYVGDCPTGMECRHLDGNPKNNNLLNLCWGTRLDNHRDRKEHLLKEGKRNGNSKLSPSNIIEIRKLHKQGLSQSYLGNIYHVNPATIALILHRITWTWVS